MIVSNIFINFEQNLTNPTEINLKRISITKNTVKISLILEIIGFSTKPSKHNNNTLNNTIPSNIVSTPLFLNNYTIYFFIIYKIPVIPNNQIIVSYLLKDL